MAAPNVLVSAWCYKIQQYRRSLGYGTEVSYNSSPSCLISWNNGSGSILKTRNRNVPIFSLHQYTTVEYSKYDEGRSCWYDIWSVFFFLFSSGWKPLAHYLFALKRQKQGSYFTYIRDITRLMQHPFSLTRPRVLKTISNEHTALPLYE